MLYMLDTNVLSEWLKQHPRIAERAASLDSGDEIAISNVAWFEIIRGRMSSILTAEDDEKLLLAQSRFESDFGSLSKFATYGISKPASSHFRAILAAKKCRKMSRNDLLIACIALAHKAVLVTRNVKDFANVPGLTLQNWFE